MMSMFLYTVIGFSQILFASSMKDAYQFDQILDFDNKEIFFFQIHYYNLKHFIFMCVCFPTYQKVLKKNSHQHGKIMLYIINCNNRDTC